MKKLIKILPIVMVVCLVCTSVFAVDIPTDEVINGGKGAEGVTTAARNIWATISTVVQFLAIAAIVFAGVRYMFASADQKADIKKSMGTLAVGAFLVFGATLVIQLIAGTTSVLEKDDDAEDAKDGKRSAIVHVIR